MRFRILAALFAVIVAARGIRADPAADTALVREIERRAALDFTVTSEDLLAELRESIPDVSQDDVATWTESGALLSRTIDGKLRYFRSAAANLFRVNADARKRRVHAPPAKKRFALKALLHELVDQAETSPTPEIYPVKHRVRYSLAVNEGHPLVKPGAKVRAWLPFPQEYRQQHDVRLISSEPSDGQVASASAPQRTVYFEQTLDSNAAPKFTIEFEFTTYAYVPRLDPAEVKPYDEASDLYREFTSERAPHILLTPEVRALAAEIVGQEANPLEKARRIFRWVSGNLPWVSEMEYAIIPSLSAKGLAARCGDCGVQGMTFITLCRAAGVPARWQSGWGTKPGEENMHDWSEFYVEPYGWLPADASYGVQQDDDPRVRDFFCGHLDPYRLIVNLDYARELEPPKTSFRSEPNDFQRGEVEIDGQNLYFNEWKWTFDVETSPGPADASEQTSQVEAVERTDPNSRLAHEQLVAKAKQGGIDLYFLGDSITRRWGTSDKQYQEFFDNWRENFFGWNASNFGWGGDTTRNILWRVQNGELDGVNPKVIVLLAGTNDLGGPKPDAEAAAAGVEAIVRECRERAPHATIILTAVFPRNDNVALLPVIAEVNVRLASLADGKAIQFLNVNDQLAEADGTLRPGMMHDGLHPAVAGYQVWADGLKPLLTELLGPRADDDHAPPPTGDPSAK
jgi:transglutaminase-like putative cysteine protease/lysophospholipase L1-like esterase